MRFKVGMELSEEDLARLEYIHTVAGRRMFGIGFERYNVMGPKNRVVDAYKSDFSMNIGDGPFVDVVRVSV